LGSGTHSKVAKVTRGESRALTVEECLTIDAADFRGVLRRGRGTGTVVLVGSEARRILRLRYEIETSSTSPVVILHLPGGESSVDIEQVIRLTPTRPWLGGRRWWFECPRSTAGGPCGRRVRCLHLRPDAWTFACRKCLGLTYESVQRHDERVDRLARLSTDELLDRYREGGTVVRALCSKALRKQRRKLERTLDRARGFRRPYQVTILDPDPPVTDQGTWSGRRWSEQVGLFPGAALS